METTGKKYQTDWNPSSLYQNGISSLTRLKWKIITKRMLKYIGAIYKGNDKGNFRLIDIGCGNAEFSNYLEPFNLFYVGLEPSFSQLKRISPRVLGKVVRGFGEYAPHRDDICDLVVLKTVLDQCYDPQKVINECWRILKPHGHVVISLTNNDAWYKILLPRKASEIAAQDRDHNYNFSRKDIERMLFSNGFQVVVAECQSYLRLPYIVENVIPKVIGKYLALLFLRISDAFGSAIIPTNGGYFIIVGKKSN